MGKKYDAAVADVDMAELFEPRQAVELVKNSAFASFDETVEVVFLLGIDPKQAEQGVRGTVALPHGTGKDVRVAVFAEGEKANEAETAGAAVVGGKELAAEIEKGRELDFDVVVSVPELMADVGKLGRILGPRGLMPNPKAGTVTQDVGKAVEEFKAGRVEYRNDRFGNVQVPLGRVSFEVDQLERNFATVADEILRARPAATKGRFVRKAVISSTMGPGFKVDPSALEDLARLVH